MREEQIRYARTRSEPALIASKILESKVDYALDRYAAGCLRGTLTIGSGGYAEIREQAKD